MVSIIIPAYNAEKHILESVESALRQDCKKEILIIDDHSEDHTWDILQDTYSGTKEVQIIKNEQKGSNPARNLGLKYASGNYIQFLDADDILGDQKIVSQLKHLENLDSCAIASCPWYHFVNHIDDTDTTFSERVWRTYDHPIDWLIDAWNGGGMMQTACWLTPGHTIQKSGGWNETITKNQDGEFFCRVLLHSSSVRFVGSSTVYYRKPIEGHISASIGYEACSSLISTYNLYTQNTLQKHQNKSLKMALANNFYRFIYETSPHHQNLLAEARTRIDELGRHKPVNVGGRIFKIMTLIMGFSLAINLRDMLKSIFRK